MTQRGEFEAAFVKRCQERGEVARLDRFDDGRYEYVDTASAWWGWQQSRESLVIQLPNQFDPIYQEFFEDVDGGCFNYSKYLNDVRAVLAAAGLKVVS